MNEQLVRARVFISYSHSDEKTAEKISIRLLDAGHELWLDRWEILPGDSLIEKISTGIVDSSYLIVLLSARSVSSNWVKKELEIAINRQLRGRNIKVIPCLLEDCEIPVFLEPLQYADFRQSFEDGVDEILPAIKMIDIKDNGKFKRDAWTHDYVYDHSFANGTEETYYINMTIISQYATHEGCVLFNIRLEADDDLMRRLTSMREHASAAIRAISFMFYFVDLNKLRKESGQKDAYILIEESKWNNKEFKLRDSKGRSIYKIKLSIRNVGEKQNNPIVYYYGSLVSHILHESMEEIKAKITPDEFVMYTKWLRENPLP